MALPVVDNSDGSYDDEVGAALTGESGPVVTDYRFERRTKTFDFLEDVTPAVLAASIDLDNTRAVTRTAKFTIDAKAARWEGLPGRATKTAIAIDPLADYLVPWHRINTGSHWIETPMGIYLLQWPQKASDGASETWQVSGNDLGIILVQNYVVQAMWSASNIAVSSTVTKTVRHQLDLRGLRSAIPPPEVGSDQLSADITYAAYSTNDQKSFADLMTAVGMYPIWFDRTGVAVSATMRDLAHSTPSVSYRDGESGMILGNWSEQGDVTNIANVVVGICDDIKLATPITSTATNASPLSRISTVNLGRSVERVIRPAGVGDQATLDALVLQELQNASRLTRSASFTTAVDPRRGPHESYRLTVEGFTDGELWAVDGYTQTLVASRGASTMSHKVSQLVAL